LIDGAALHRYLLAMGCDFFTGVPDTTLRSAFDALITSDDYVPAVSEPAAIGLAVGAWLGGRSPVVLMQNSGFASAMNVLTSLVLVYRVPLLLVIGWRGYLGHDSVEHSVIGRTLTPMIDSLEIPWWQVSDESLERDTAEAMRATGARRSCAALLVTPEHRR
jgi:phosphonopyruvate decarboxylase